MVEPSSRWGGPKAALAGILGLAAALRLVGIEYGLPFPLLNPDERNIVPRAWQIVHGGGLDPDWFDYPTLVLYLLAPVQRFAETPSYLEARLVIVALALGAVAATWWLGRRAYGVAAGAVGAACLAVETTHVAYSHVAVTDIPLTLGVAAALALMVGGRLELAGIVTGLAMSAKYPGVWLLAPLVAAGWAKWWRLARCCTLALLAFVATSPYVLLDLGQSAGDVFRVQRLAREGWLGFENDHFRPIAFLDRLWEGLGPALVIAGIGLVAALARRSTADRVLAIFVLVYFLQLMTLGAHFDRYVLPLVPALGVLAGRVRALTPVTLLLLVIPLTWSVHAGRELLKTDTRLAALAWIDENVPAGAAIAVDPSTPPLPELRTVRLELPGPGREPDPRRDVGHLRAEGVRYVLVTGAVVDRVLAARHRYPRESRFYDELQRAPRALYVEPGDELAGPWVALYTLAP